MNSAVFLASLGNENLMIGFRVFVVGFLGVIVCMTALSLSMKGLMLLVARFEAAQAASAQRVAAAKAATAAAPGAGAKAPAAAAPTAPAKADQGSSAASTAVSKETN